MNKQLEEIWEKIESWDSIHRDVLLGSHLNEPAPDDIVRALNSALDERLPVDFLDSLRRHDGTNSCSTAFYHGQLLSAAQILETLNDIRWIAQDLADAAERNGVTDAVTLVSTGSVKDNFLSDYWIPFHVTDWLKTCFDFDPAEGGEKGQIIEVDWEDGTVKVIAKNFVEFLHMCAEHLPDELSE